MSEQKAEQAVAAATSGESSASTSTAPSSATKLKATAKEWVPSVAAKEFVPSFAMPKAAGASQSGEGSAGSSNTSGNSSTGGFQQTQAQQGQGQGQYAMPAGAPYMAYPNPMGNMMGMPMPMMPNMPYPMQGQYMQSGQPGPMQGYYPGYPVGVADPSQGHGYIGMYPQQMMMPNPQQQAGRNNYGKKGSNYSRSRTESFSSQGGSSTGGLQDGDKAATSASKPASAATPATEGGENGHKDDSAGDNDNNASAVEVSQSTKSNTNTSEAGPVETPAGTGKEPTVPAETNAANSASEKEEPVPEAAPAPAPAPVLESKPGISFKGALNGDKKAPPAIVTPASGNLDKPSERPESKVEAASKFDIVEEESPKSATSATSSGATNGRAMGAAAGSRDAKLEKPVPNKSGRSVVKDDKWKSDRTDSGKTEERRGGDRAPVADKEESSGWRRGEVVKPLTISDMLEKSQTDGVPRFDKIKLILMRPRKGMEVPEGLRSVYPSYLLFERQPILPKGFIMPSAEEEAIAEETARIFAGDKEGMFKHDATLLANEEDPEVIFRKANLILNKLSVTKFEKLSDEFMQVGIDKLDCMERVVELLVSKAQMEEHFCFMYADLCRKIVDVWGLRTIPMPEREEEAGGEAKEGGEAGPQTTTLGAEFRYKLLLRCQVEFDVDRAKAVEEVRQLDISPEERVEKEIILKKRYTGHMRFIGEIYMKDLVSSNIMRMCVTELLGTEEEETLVCLIKLLATIGAKLQDSSKKNMKFLAEQFVSIEQKSKGHSSSRVRFMLRDLIDMRKDGWQARREEVKATKLGEQQEPQQGQQGSGSGSGFGGGSKGSQTVKQLKPAGASGGAKGAPAQAAADEWTTVPSKAKSNRDKGGQAPAFGSNSSSSRPAMDTKGGFGALSRSSGRDRDGKDSKRKDRDRDGHMSKSSSRDHLSKDSSGKREKNNGKHSSSSHTSSRSDGSATGSRKAAAAAAGDFEIIEEDDAPSASGSAGPGSSTTSPGVSRTTTPGLAGGEGEGVNESNLVGADGHVDKATLSKTKTILDEYLSNQIDEDLLLEFRSLIHSNGYGEVLKYLINVIVERKADDRVKFCRGLGVLHRGGLLSGEQAVKGTTLFLHDLDDIAIDVPLAPTNSAYVLASLVANNVLSLAFLATLPEENNFTISMNAATFVGATLSEVAKQCPEGVERAKTEYKLSGVDVLSQVMPDPKQSAEDAQTEFVKKYDLPFLLSKDPVG